MMPSKCQKNKIKDIIVVEGKSDTQKLKSLFDVRTIETNGSCIDKKTIDYIKKVSEKNSIILFLDPDYQGERIRKILQKHLIKYKQAFLKKTNKKQSKKYGVAEASKNEIIDALKNATEFSTKQTPSISWKDFMSLQINTKCKRLNICNLLNISYCNNKQLYQRINLLNLSKKDLKKLLSN